jgi:hypothetical protein
MEDSAQSSGRPAFAIREVIYLYEERIARGIAVMDRVKPGWVSSIDLSTFDIQDTGMCVVGQVFGGSYTAAIERLSECIGMGSEVTEVVCGFGFTFDVNSPWDELNDEWRSILADLQRELVPA